ncbi:MAG: hypothetical protein DI536_23815 [Archangium gephyra]|uniref:Uncharacterized protein n=1 Tax=Archangium gephyra TaxID=48 RepID=A0A2W5SZL3_9BACT|nr:MAG: hypothetical protein DI536_23815 [Archangium gephyra]
MAAKKKSTAKKAPAAKATKAAAPAKTPPKRDSVAAKTLSSLPALTGKLRMAYRAAFTDAQCEKWGELTKAENVIKEAEKWVVTLERTLKDDVESGYSRRRLTFLCELLVLLEDEMANTSEATMRDLRSTRGAALVVASNARKDLARRLRAVAGGQQQILARITAAAPSDERSPSDVQDSLTATIDIAVKLRRDEVLEALADDVGLTEARLNSAYAALEALAGVREVTLNAAAYEGDAPTVNVIEGRVLREMRLAQRLLKEARDLGGKNLPVLVAGPSLNKIFGKNAADVEDPAPTPPSP